MKKKLTSILFLLDTNVVQTIVNVYESTLKNFKSTHLIILIDLDNCRKHDSVCNKKKDGLYHPFQT